MHPPEWYCVGSLAYMMGDLVALSVSNKAFPGYLPGLPWAGIELFFHHLTYYTPIPVGKRKTVVYLGGSFSGFTISKNHHEELQPSAGLISD